MMKSAIENAIRHSNFLGRQVVDADSALVIGQVADLWVDLRQHQVMGFSSRSSFWDTCPTIHTWANIERLSPRQVTVQSTPAIHPSLMRRLTSDTGMAVTATLSLEVWTQRGDWVGEIIDFCFDASTGSTNYYLCAPRENLGQKPLSLSPSLIVDGGKGWLLVSDQVTPRVRLVTEEEDLFPIQLTFAS